MRIVLIVSALLAFPSASATAQMDEPGASTPEGKQGPPVYKPALKTLPETPRWKTAILQGSTNTEGHRFHIASLDLLQPVAVILVAPNAADDMTLKLFKDDFTKPLRESSTDDRGIARFQIRTQGDLRMIVSSKEGVKGYQLIVMVGDEVKIPVPSLFVPVSYAGVPLATAPANVRGAASTAASPPPDESRSGGRPIVLWVIAGSLVVITAMLGAILFRKKRGQNTTALLLMIALPLLTPGSLPGQEPSAPEEIALKDVMEDAKPLLDELVKVNAKLATSLEMAEKFLELFEAFTAADEADMPDYSPPGMPGLPTACVSTIPAGVAKAIGEVDWTGPCGECFVEAHEEISETLQRFEKLRRVHARTERVYKTSTAFGDGASKVGGIITAAGWMKIRKGIKENMDKYYVVYDDKVVELTDALTDALKKVATCEMKYFNNPSWYDRYGFMFVNPVVERHRR